MKLALTHTTAVIRYTVFKVFTMIFLGFAKTSSIVWGMLEILDIFGGNLSGQVFFLVVGERVQSSCWGPAYVAGKS